MKLTPSSARRWQRHTRAWRGANLTHVVWWQRRRWPMTSRQAAHAYWCITNQLSYSALVQQKLQIWPVICQTHAHSLNSFIFLGGENSIYYWICRLCWSDVRSYEPALTDTIVCFVFFQLDISNGHCDISQCSPIFSSMGTSCFEYTV